MRLLVVTPIFRPSVGGAATYYDLLTRCLLDADVIESAVVITESIPDLPAQSVERSGRLKVLRLFAHRASASMGTVRKCVRYGIQNLQYFLLPRIIRSQRPDLLLIHSSFYNQPGTFAWIMKRIVGCIPAIVDCRDQQLPTSELHRLESYQQIIAASQNIVSHLRQCTALHSRILQIPVIQEPLGVPSVDASNNVLRKFGLRRNRYILFAGLIKASKGIDLLLDSYALYRALLPNPCELAIAGVSKDSMVLARAAAADGTRLLGSVPRIELLTLMQNAAININLSFSEGMPRTSLEALALGARVLLPPGIPEFEQYCGSSIARIRDPRKIAAQLVEILDAPPAKYPTENHSVSRVLEMYKGLFEKVLK